MEPAPSDNIEKYQEIIDILGEEKIEMIYSLIGSVKFSFATVRNLIKKRKIISSINDGLPLRKIASKNGGSKMTIYRYLKNGIKK